MSSAGVWRLSLGNHEPHIEDGGVILIIVRFIVDVYV